MNLQEILYRLIRKTYQRPYEEFGNIVRGEQILFLSARKGYRPTIPAECPRVISEVISMCWRENQDMRPNTGYLLSIVNSLRTRYENNKSDWDSFAKHLTLEIPSLPPLVQSESSGTPGHNRSRNFSISNSMSTECFIPPTRETLRRASLSFSTSLPSRSTFEENIQKNLAPVSKRDSDEIEERMENLGIKNESFKPATPSHSRKTKLSQSIGEYSKSAFLLGTSASTLSTESRFEEESSLSSDIDSEEDSSFPSTVSQTPSREISPTDIYGSSTKKKSIYSPVARRKNIGNTFVVEPAPELAILPTRIPPPPPARTPPLRGITMLFPPPLPISPPPLSLRSLRRMQQFELENSNENPT
jgi:hypothetical protein